MHTDRDPELDKLRRRYVAADRRYLRLNYGIFRLSDRERGRFAKKLARAADAITPRELETSTHAWANSSWPARSRTPGTHTA